MPKFIKLKESSFNKLLEYVGDEEALGRYDIEPDKYINMSGQEHTSLTHQTKNLDGVVYEPITDDEWEGEQYVGQEYFDPYKRDLKQ